MSLVTIIWLMGAGASLTLAALHIAVWLKDRAAPANLAFGVMTISVALFSALELGLMRASSPEAGGEIARWVHVPAWLTTVSLLAFVRLFLHAGHTWLA